MYIIFVLKSVTQFRIMSTVSKMSQIRRLEKVYFCKKIWCMHASGDWTYIHSRKTQHFSFTMNCGTYFLYSVIFHSKYVMLHGLFMPSFGDWFIFIHFYSVDLRWIIPLSWTMIFCTFLVVHMCALMLNL